MAEEPFLTGLAVQGRFRGPFGAEVLVFHPPGGADSLRRIRLDFDQNPREILSMIAAETALRRLREGNRRFAAGEGSATGVFHDHLIEAQMPMAVVLGCSDSRVPPEVLFDQELGDLFVVRVAGNVVAPTQIGSVEYAVRVLGTRLVVVLGHSRCGAVIAALDPAPGAVSPALASVLRRIATGSPDSEIPDEARLRTAVRSNVLNSVGALEQDSEWLVEERRNGGVMIVGAEFDFETSVVEFLDPAI